MSPSLLSSFSPSLFSFLSPLSLLSLSSSLFSLSLSLFIRYNEEHDKSGNHMDKHKLKGRVL